MRRARRVVHADRVLPGKEPPRRVVDLTQAARSWCSRLRSRLRWPPPRWRHLPPRPLPPRLRQPPLPPAAAAGIRSRMPLHRLLRRRNPPRRPNAPAAAAAEPAAVPAAPRRPPAATSIVRRCRVDQEIFDKTLEELLAQGTDRRIAEGKARRAAMIAARKKARARARRPAPWNPAADVDWSMGSHAARLADWDVGDPDRQTRRGTRAEVVAEDRARCARTSRAHVAASGGAGDRVHRAERHRVPFACVGDGKRRLDPAERRRSPAFDGAARRSGCWRETAHPADDRAQGRRRTSGRDRSATCRAGSSGSSTCSCHPTTTG